MTTMTNSVTINTQGLDQLERDLNSLGRAASRKVLRTAVKEASQPIYNDAMNGVRSKWGKQTGALEKSIKLRVKTGRRGSWADVYSGVGVYILKGQVNRANRFYGTYMGAPTLAYWFEYGIKPHELGKGSRAGSSGRASRSTGGGMHPGVGAQPVLRPALDNNINQAIASTAAILRREIDNVRSQP